MIYRRCLQLDIPHYIGICGYPQAGKTTVADLLAAEYGSLTVDDGLVLRKGAMELYGLTWADVSTQEGKAREVEVCGKKFTVRQLLGDLGKLMEAKHGSQFMPDRAIASITDHSKEFYVFPSVRMDQGLTYLKNHGVVLEIVRDGCTPVYDFDQYDKSLVTHTIVNNSTINDLKKNVGDFLRHFDTDRTY